MLPEPKLAMAADPSAATAWLHAIALAAAVDTITPEQS
jgi:hypothetical protein